MADFLEDFESKDADRNIDQCSFNSSQFEIFTHDFRENGDADCKDVNGDHTDCKHNEEELRKSKKELVNVMRKLQKAIVSMKNLPDIEFLQKAMQDINNQLRDAILKENAEFSTTTVNLPDFDQDDMQLFFGDLEVPEQKSMLERVKEEQSKSKEELQNLWAQANILLLEYDHMKHGLRA